MPQTEIDDAINRYHKENKERTVRDKIRALSPAGEYAKTKQKIIQFCRMEKNKKTQFLPTWQMEERK